jgi:two-component system, OmpR family, sensor histidine kinase KdpD
VAERENVFALAAFVLVGVAVSGVVDLAARRTRQAARAGVEAHLLATLAGAVLHGERPLAALLERVREAFDLESVTLLQRRDPERHPTDARRRAEAWRVAAAAGGSPSPHPSDGQTEVPVDDGLVLVLRGRSLAAADRRLVEAFATHAAIALRQQRLGEQAATARELAEIDRLRTALLSAVSHDLRSPLASAKASVGSLRGTAVTFSEEDRRELLATAEESLDRLDRLVDNLLDMSRLQAGALALDLQEVSVLDAVTRAMDDLGEGSRPVAVSVPADLPDVMADPALLERILVNVLANALRFSPPQEPPSIAASVHDARVHLRVVDHGPGIPQEERDRVFRPFQRMGDRDNTTGVGLGLALSRGLAEAMGGTLGPDETPGGGVTMILTLRVAT